MKIAQRTLRAWGACSDQVEQFAREWPKGAGATRATLARAALRRLLVFPRDESVRTQARAAIATAEGRAHGE